MSVPKNCTLLSRTSHNDITAIRVNDDLGIHYLRGEYNFIQKRPEKESKEPYGWGHIFQKKNTNHLEESMMVREFSVLSLKSLQKKV